MYQELLLMGRDVISKHRSLRYLMTIPHSLPMNELLILCYHTLPPNTVLSFQLLVAKSLEASLIILFFPFLVSNSSGYPVDSNFKINPEFTFITLIVATTVSFRKPRISVYSNIHTDAISTIKIKVNL